MKSIPCIPYKGVFYIAFVLTLCSIYNLPAQVNLPIIDLGGQIRTRTEFRDGQGTLPLKGADPAFFTSQRTRLNLGLKGDRYQFFVSVQDVRVWGQDISSINRVSAANNNSIIFHQAWGEVLLADSNSFLNGLKLKIGRQELVYDDQRLLGNLDWLQQGRRHDAILLKLDKSNYKLHIGAAFNQNRENSAGTVYIGNPALDPSFPSVYPISSNGLRNMYKSLQFLHFSKSFGNLGISYLFLKDDFQKFQRDSVIRYGTGTWSRFTTGFHSNYAFGNKSSLTGSIYYQGGKSPEGKSVSAVLASVYSDIKINNTFSIGPGVDYTSGGNNKETGTKTQAFDPLYGTPHKFWGYMDYFYVATPMLPTGLLDFYFRTNFVKNKFLASLIVHEFHIPSDLVINGEQQNKRLGTEVDLELSYNLTQNVSFIGGYAFMAGTNTLANVKRVNNAERFGQFAYLMVNIRSFK